MQKSFQNVPKDVDTKILLQNEIEINNLTALYQFWNWDGILGNSIIFHNIDVLNLSDDEIIQQINSSGFAQIDTPDATISRSKSSFTFINFGFEST